ncbi:hypothetical protein NSK_004013 [Nannochloropsis salina CCMP1776]|uniref:Uncharacterized protein n=1 Tax=Nannochloropsis salina CCMP1776 TaxID=1027361 RepID=A0A4D9D2H7_9STRA|nr:hypothetical protein NSK_004013 [Nannochloropsis salina CCMP1776]|eukprot:TFJ84547.1 hypothetical protein NSK_004013 [Nannochloropsis salina CCMP1776]
MSTVSALSSSSSAAPPSSNTVVPATYSNLNDNALQKPLLDATCPEPVGASILYEDDFVKLTKSSLRIKWYYFPIGASKVIPLKSIQKISLRPLGSMWQGQYKHWGMAIDFKRWWPSDMLRHQRAHFIEVDCGTWPLVAFTLKESEDFYRSLSQVRSGP